MIRIPNPASRYCDRPCFDMCGRLTLWLEPGAGYRRKTRRPKQEIRDCGHTNLDTQLWIRNGGTCRLAKAKRDAAESKDLYTGRQRGMRVRRRTLVTGDGGQAVPMSRLADAAYQMRLKYREFLYTNHTPGLYDLYGNRSIGRVTFPKFPILWLSRYTLMHQLFAPAV